MGRYGGGQGQEFAQVDLSQLFVPICAIVTFKWYFKETIHS